MNILVLSWRDPEHPTAGGAEQVMHEHMRGWVRAGHKITLFSAHFKGASREESIDGVKIVRRGYQILGVHIAAFIWYFLGKHEKFDLVVDQFHGVPFFIPLYVRLPKLAVLQEIAKEVWLMNHLPKPFNLIIGYLGYYLEPLIFKFYKKVPFMVGSESAKEDLEKFGIPAKNITIVSHGVLLPKSKILDLRSKTKTIVFLGSLTRDKGIEDAIRTFAILSKKGEFRFWIVGKGGKNYHEELGVRCLRLGIKNKVKFWGFVSQKKKFELLEQADVLINPSIREGWGLVNIEANAMGTPVVAYRSPGLIDSVKDGQSGILCEKNTPQEMADEVFNLLKNENLYKKLQGGAILWSKNFSWEKSKKRSLTLINQIVSL